MWVSLISLFVLLSGLPWATSWGNYLTWARNLSAVTAGQPTWPVGTTQDPATIAGPRPIGQAGNPMPGMSAAEMVAMTGRAPAILSVPDVSALNRLVPLAGGLHPPRPIWIVAPAAGASEWTIESHVQNRPLRITYTATPNGRVVGISDFAGQNIVEKVVAVTTATHEGQLFGRLNQAVLVATAASLILVAISGIVMWWRRRPAKVLGAPPVGAERGSAPLLAVVILAFVLLLPLYGLSLLLVLVLDSRCCPEPR